MTALPSQPPPGSQQRPAGITILAVLFAGISLFHLLRFVQSLLAWDELSHLSLAVSPAYLAGDGLAWFLAGLILSAAVWRGRDWAWSASQILSGIYLLYGWVNKLWIAVPGSLGRTWPISLILSLLGIGLVLVIMRRKTSRRYFGKSC